MTIPQENIKQIWCFQNQYRNASRFPTDNKYLLEGV